MKNQAPTPRIITYEAWYEVSDCPIQRDTERHAKMAVKKHLKEAASTHANVNAAELPDGTLYKLDGHTRAYLWQRGELEKPSNQLVMMVYRAESINDVKELYKQFDNASATESSKDKLSGIYRDMGLTPQSNTLEHGGVITALKIIHAYNKDTVGRQFDMYSELPKWIDELVALDGLNSETGKMTTPCIAAFFITYKLYGRDSMTFWHNYINDLGVKQGGARDGVQALTELIETRKAAKQNQGQANHREILAKAISCFEKFVAGSNYTVGIKSTDVAKYLDRNNFFK